LLARQRASNDELSTLVRHVLEQADPEDREFALRHPGLDLRPRHDLLEVVVAHDGRVIGGFGAKLPAVTGLPNARTLLAAERLFAFDNNPLQGPFLH
jgi:hypothetical protein